MAVKREREGESHRERERNIREDNKTERSIRCDQICMFRSRITVDQICMREIATEKCGAKREPEERKTDAAHGGESQRRRSKCRSQSCDFVDPQFFPT